MRCRCAACESDSPILSHRRLTAPICAQRPPPIPHTRPNHPSLSQALAQVFKAVLKDRPSSAPLLASLNELAVRSRKCLREAGGEHAARAAALARRTYFDDGVGARTDVLAAAGDVTALLPLAVQLPRALQLE